jgi:hypothetical protein
VNTYIHLYYVTEFFLEWEILQTKVVVKIKTHILCSITFFQKLDHLWDNVEKYGRGKQTKWWCNRCICFVCWIAQATDTHLEYVIFIAFPRQQWLCECTTLFLVYVCCLSCSICFCCTRVIQNLFEGQCSVYIYKFVYIFFWGEGGATGCVSSDLRAELSKQFTTS